MDYREYKQRDLGATVDAYLALRDMDPLVQCIRVWLGLGPNRIEQLLGPDRGE